MEAKKTRRSHTRYGAFRVLVNLMWGRYSFLSWDGSKLTIARPARLARLLSLETRQLRKHLEWLEAQGFVEDLYPRGETWTLTMENPLERH